MPCARPNCRQWGLSTQWCRWWRQPPLPLLLSRQPHLPHLAPLPPSRPPRPPPFPSAPLWAAWWRAPVSWSSLCQQPGLLQRRRRGLFASFQHDVQCLMPLTDRQPSCRSCAGGPGLLCAAARQGLAAAAQSAPCIWPAAQVAARRGRCLGSRWGCAAAPSVASCATTGIERATWRLACSCDHALAARHVCS